MTEETFFIGILSKGDWAYTTNFETFVRYFFPHLRQLQNSNPYDLLNDYGIEILQWTTTEDKLYQWLKRLK